MNLQLIEPDSTTTVPSGPSMITPAVQCPPFGGWDEVSPTSGDGIAKFTTVCIWVSPEARRQWYEDFSDGATKNYERLGWIVDMLKILTVGAESRLLKMNGF